MKRIFTIVFSLLLGANLFLNAQTLTDIDLSSSSDATALETTIAGLTEGSRIILKPGFTYNFQSYSSIGYDLHIDGGSGAKPIINLKNFDVVDGAALSLIKISNVIIIGTDYSSDYLMNISTGCSVTDFTIEDCEVKDLRGGFRIKNSNAVTVSNFTISNSIIDNLGGAGNGYGLLNHDNPNAVVTNVKIENSTLTNIDRMLMLNKVAGDLGSLTLSDCTFNLCLNSGKYISDMKGSDGSTYNYTNGVAVTNCIFGVTPEANTKAYIRVGGSTAVTYSNVFKTTEVADWSLLRTDDTGITTYSGSSTDLFTDPVNGNYLIKDAAFAGGTTAGDPRWYYGTTAISSNKVSDVKLVVAADYLIFSEAMASVKIYSLTGNSVASYTQVSKVSISNLQSGMFIVTATDQQGLILTTKFIK